MKNLILIPLFAIITLAIGCKKVTIVEETIIEEGQGPAAINIYGVWEYQDPDTSEKDKEYWEFTSANPYYKLLEQRESGLNSVEYGTFFITPTHFRRANYGNRPYTLKGDSLIINGWDPTDEDDIYLRVDENSINFDDLVKPLSITRSVTVPSFHSISSSNSFGIEGDFLHVNHRSLNVYKFMKLNTINGVFTDSSTVPGGNWYALHFRTSNNKLYNTRYSGSYNLQQRVGISGGNSNLSSNILNSIRAISVNPSSGTVYAYRNGTMYSGTEGGNFSILKSFSGTYPSGQVYYKNDQFLGSYNGTLVLFEIAPELKIIQQYEIPGRYIYDAKATDGTNVWVMNYNNSIGRYEYSRVSLN